LNSALLKELKGEQLGVSPTSMSMKRVLWWLIGGTRGGANRARIISTLHNRPANANQIAELLGLDYKTVRHHLDVLVKNRLLVTQGEGYGMVYFLSQELEDSYDSYSDIWVRFGKTSKSGDS